MADEFGRRRRVDGREPRRAAVRARYQELHELEAELEQLRAASIAHEAAGDSVAAAAAARRCREIRAEIATARAALRSSLRRRG